MKHHRLLVATGIAALALPVMAQMPGQRVTLVGDAAAQGGAASYVIAPASKLWIEGNSNVRSFRCEAKKLEGRVRAGDGGTSAVEAARSVQAAQLTVAAGKLDCGNTTMNDHMWKALDAWDHPGIDFQLQSQNVMAEGGGTVARMKGRLTIAGTTRPITLDGTVTGGGSQLRVVGSKQLRMTDFGVKPPSLFLGTMKVADRVEVHYDLLLTQ